MTTSRETVLPPDDLERREALDISRSFICEAPAGSGKTELLTQRLLALLAKVKQPEEVLAITFTRKAAAEMRQRVIDALKLAQNSEEPMEEHKRQTWRLARELKKKDESCNWQLLNAPQRLGIQTFDSFCATLTRQLPLHAVVGSGLKIAEKPLELYQKTVTAFLSLLEGENCWREAISTLLAHLDNNIERLSELLIDLLSKRDAWMPVLMAEGLEHGHRDILESHLQHIVDDKIARVVRQFPEELAADLLSASYYAAKNLADVGDESPLAAILQTAQLKALPGSSDSELEYWSSLLFLIFTNSGQLRKTVNKNTGFPPAAAAKKTKEEKSCKDEAKRQVEKIKGLLAELRERPDLLEGLQELRHLPALAYSDKQWQVLSALTRVLPRLVAELQLCFKEGGELDFSEVAMRASQALGEELEPTDISLRLDYKIKHILVDEFQDSSINQVKLLRQLTRGWEPGDGRSLFCVGDAMQSIYGFRGANVGLFLYCKEQGIGGLSLQPLRLSANFRSKSEIVNWVNSTFGSAFPKEDDISQGAVSYSLAKPIKESRSDEPSVITYGFDELAGKQEEARIIVENIKKIRSKSAAHNEGTIESTVPTVAILVRSRSHAEHILPELTRAGVAFRAVDLLPLREKPVIQDLLSLTRALLYPADKLAWLSVLRAPWCGLKLADLEQLVKAGNSKSQLIFEKILRCLNSTDPAKPGTRDMFDQLIQQEDGDDSAEADFDRAANNISSDGLKRIGRIVRIIQVCLSQRQRLPLCVWLEGCWFELGGPACLQAEEDKENVEAYFNLLEKEEQSGALSSLEYFENRLSDLYAQPDPKADASLQIMTIHKSKGLEFDVVILPSLHRASVAPKSELFLWKKNLRQNGEDELVFAPITESGEDTEQTYRHLHVEKAKKEALESCRLLYVACTRAKKQLYLSAIVKTTESGEPKDPQKNSLLSYIWLPFRKSLQLIQASVDNKVEVEESGTPKSFLRRLPPEWSMPALPKGNLLKHFIPDFNFDNSQAQIVEFQDPAQRHVGTLVHQLLNEMVVHSLPVWIEKYQTSPKEALGNWRARLLGLGLARASLDRALQKLENNIQKIIDDKNIAWMLGVSHKEIHSEYPISLVSENGQLNNYVIDLLLRDNKGQTWIIDFKSSEPSPGQSLNDFKQEEKQIYQSAMAHYAKAVSAVGYENIRSALYFPLIAEWVYYEVD